MAAWRFCKEQGPTDLVCNRIDGHNGEHHWTKPIIEQPRPDLAGDRARDLGAEHGKAAAEAWAVHYGRVTMRQALRGVSIVDLPEPELTDSVLRALLGDLLTPMAPHEVCARDALVDAYRGAFRTARDETIREAVR